ncbi:MAG: hypothetical protein ED559_03710 [Phycisphaera sp.]|nr:MAG: hypothetical protein ED559_03710 [Phycisphaera sp.]
MRFYTLAALTMTATTASAQNVTFSFASDNASERPTFAGTADDGQMSFFRVGTDLLVDDANGPLPTLEYDTLFYNDFTLTTVGSTLLPSGQYLHTYSIDGSFSFQGVTVMTVTIEDGVFTALGGEFSWGSTATIQASSLAGSTVTYEWMTDDQPAYNLFDGAITSDMTDAAFTLTRLLSFPDGGQETPGVALNPGTGLPTDNWQSEGSYSGSAFFIPAPSSALLVTAAGIGLVRRRR